MEVGGRIKYLDGLRGFAILWVILYHAFSRWPNLPYGYRYWDLLPFKYGWLGVELFFMLSGFVITMTLERCSSWREFIVRRWLRLFPAMLIVSLLIFLTAPILPERPAGMPQLSSLLPGLLMLDPLWLKRVFGMHYELLEGAFWSLFVEVKFYLLFGAVFYLAGRRWATIFLAAAFGMALLTWGLSDVLPLIFSDKLFLVVNNYLGFQYYGSFLVGALLFSLRRRFSLLKLAAVWVAGVVNCLFYAIKDRDPVIFAIGLFVVALFVGSAYSGLIQRLLMRRWLLFLGFVSYPLYLLHENMMVAMIKKIGHSLRPLPDLMIPGLPILVVLALSYLIARYLEPCCRRAIAAVLDPVFIRSLPQRLAAAHGGGSALP